MRQLVGLWCVLALSACVGARVPTKSATATSADSQAQALAAPAALEELHRLERARAAASALVPFLGHGDSAVRARAALALARVGDPDGAPRLIKALGDSDPGVRRNAAFALGSLDTELPLLADQLASGHRGAEPWVREAAQVRADAERALDARLHVEQNPLVRRAIYAALGPLAIGPGLHHIYAGMQGDDDDAAHAALAFGVHAWRRGKDAHKDPTLFTRLIALGRSASAEVRFGAVYALARHDNCDAAALFAERVEKDPDAGVRGWAVRGLGACPGQTAVLLKALGDVDWRVRVESLRALTKRARGEEAFDLSPVAAAAAAAAQAVAQTEVPPNLAAAYVLSTALPLLVEEATLRPLLDRVRTAPAERDLSGLRCDIAVAIAARTLDLAPLAACGRTGEAPRQVRLREIRALELAAQSAPPQRARLHRYLADADPRVRAAAVGALEGADDAATRSLLVARLEADHDPATIEAIADLIAGWPADPALAGPLTVALGRTEQARDASVLTARVGIARALAVHGKQAAAALLAQLADRDPLPVRNAVRSSLGLRPAYGQAPPFGAAPALDPAGLAARIVTTRGTIEIALFADAAPETVANFIRLARGGVYDGLTFHRVVPGFVVQGGDPRGDGFGGPGYAIPCELTAQPFVPGVVGMALSGKDTGGSQFFIMQSRQPHLDGRYTAFGMVTAGHDVVDSIQPDDLMRSVEIVPAAAPAPLSSGG